MKAFVVFIFYVCFVRRFIYAQEAWSLQRAEMDEYRIVFKNTTITSKIMISSWSWRDSLAGMWDTGIRVSLANNSFQSGHLDYRDGYGNEMLRVRWQQSPQTNLTWKAIFATKFPPTSWNMSSSFLNWGYKPTSETTWLFYIGELSFEPKPSGKVVLNPLEDVLGMWLRRKRSTERMKRSTASLKRQNQASAFSLIDLFTGDGIFSSLPQLFINIFSFFASLFPPQGDDYQADGSATEPDAEVLTNTKAPSDATMKRLKNRKS